MTARALLMGLAVGSVALGFFLLLVHYWTRRRSFGRNQRRVSHDHVDWQQIQHVLNEALELAPGERAAFTAHAFADNPASRREVNSLLAEHDRAGMLDRSAPALPVPPPDSIVHSSRVQQHVALPAGRIIGNYEILETVGRGGMGIVYKARDQRLGRIVALKFLPRDLCANVYATERFLVEAQAAAALDHPNVCVIHEIAESDDGYLFLAMPFYDGETLKHHLAGGALNTEYAIDIAVQVGRGLATAHERGIVHRDIKPANVLVTPGGPVKILDFGVAKLAGITLNGWDAPAGTVAYMSPEQTVGDDVDGRSDVWSLGVLLYEMLTGERPFCGENDAALMAAILTAEPAPVSARRHDVTTALDELVARALARDRDHRFPTALDMVQALEDVLEPSLDAVGAGERRQATIVACTVSGYDALVGKLAPAAMQELARSIRNESTAIAGKHGGTVNHCSGDQIVLLFGIPDAHEDDGVRGARSALELRARVRKLSDTIEETGGPMFRLHTGVDTGRVIVHTQEVRNADRRYRVVGQAALVAERIAAHADADEVWASPEWQHLSGSFFETEIRGAFVVRDRPEPLVPVCVLRESGVRTRLEAAEKHGLTPYTGRAAEMEILQRSLHDALGGNGQFVTVTGEAGIGKSRLLHEFRATLGDVRLACVLGRCQADGSGIPYLPFTEILRAILGIHEPDVGAVRENPAAHIRSISAELEEFIPLYLHLLSIHDSEFRVPDHLQGHTLQLAIEEAIAALLTRSAHRQPLVLLLEDWHWSDEASRSALEHVALASAGYRMLIVVTRRSGYGVQWSAPVPHTTIPLLPLEPHAVAALLRSFLRVQHLPEDLDAIVRERTGGNPFFLEEICMALLEEGAIRIHAGEARATGPLRLLDLPDSIEAVIRARLDRLDRNARDVLRVASVAGHEFTRIVLERTVTVGDRLAEALDKLEAAGLIQQFQNAPEALYRFNHILTQEVVYAGLLEHQRRDLHRGVGTAIEQIGQHRIDEYLDRLAHHFSRAEEWAKAVGYGMRSAARAASLAQYADALHVLDRTQRWLIHLPAGTERRDGLLETLLRQERLCETLGQRDRQQQIINELIRLLEPDGDRATLAEVHLRQGDLCTLLRRCDEGEQALHRSLDIWRELADEKGEQKALRSLGLLRWLHGRNREAVTCIAEVIAVERTRNDVVALVGDLFSLAIVRKALGEHAQARVALEEGLALAEEAIVAGSRSTAELRVRQAYIFNALAILHREAGDMDGALACLERAGNIAEGEAAASLPLYHHVVAARVYLHQGRIEESLARYRTVVKLARKSRHLPGLSQGLLILGEVLVGLNRNDEALPCLDEAADLFARLQDPAAEVRVWAQIATAHEAREDHGSASAAWTRTRVLHRQLGSMAGELKAVEGLGGAARRQATEPALALAYYYEALQLACGLDDRAAEGRLRNTLGILEWSRGEYALALTHYERAFAVFSDLHDTAHAGLMLNSVGVTLKQLGRSTEAQSRLEAAVLLHRETGERQLEGHALAALGDISSERGDRRSAVEYYERSLEIRRGIGDDRGEAWMLYNLALASGTASHKTERLSRVSHLAHRCGDQELTAACARLQHSSE